MNYYGARQIGTDEPTPDAGKHRYMGRVGNNWIAQGYCAEDAGHDTAEDAEACFTGWLLDHRLALNLGGGEWECVASECGKPTHRQAECCGNLYPLCPTHMRRETVAELMPRVGRMEREWLW